MFWGTLGLNPGFILALGLTEMCATVVRAVYFCNSYIDHYPIVTLILACFFAVALQLLLLTYLLVTSVHYRAMTAAIMKLRDYISQFTFHKLPSLYLVCILMPPLIKDMMACASQRDAALSAMSNNYARPIVTAANQVVCA